MAKLLYESAKRLAVGGPRNLWRVYKTTRGIKVVFRSLYESGNMTLYFRDGEYPPFPKNWEAVNKYKIKAAENWIDRLLEGRAEGIYRPYRTTP